MPFLIRVGNTWQCPKSENTSVAYYSDFNHFIKWCEYHGLPSLPTTDEAYVMYLTDLAAAGYKVSTIKRRMTSISQAYQLKEYPSPNTIYVKTVWSGIPIRECYWS